MSRKVGINVFIVRQGRHILDADANIYLMGEGGVAVHFKSLCVANVVFSILSASVIPKTVFYFTFKLLMR